MVTPQTARRDLALSGQVDWAHSIQNEIKSDAIPKTFLRRIQHFKTVTNKSMLRVVTTPKLMVLCFKNIRRGLMWSVRAALRELLLSWAVFGIIFVRGSVIELITCSIITVQVVATLKMIGVIQL